jgi:putative toxin-antitoxin system antitoxin component (TIGR02293 family)
MAKPAVTETEVSARRPPSDLAAYRRLIREKRGGPNVHVRLLGFEISGSLALLERVEAGFSYQVFERFQRNVDLSTPELLKLVQISPRTLIRRKDEGRLSSEESDRLLRASRVFGGALALFEGDLASTRAWFSRPARALGGRSPQDVAATEMGAREVENLVGRLEHGVFS